MKRELGNVPGRPETDIVRLVVMSFMILVCTDQNWLLNSDVVVCLLAFSLIVNYNHFLLFLF